MLNEDDLKDFRQWQRTKHQTALEHAFHEIDDLLSGTRDYTVTMPAKAFRTLANALVLLKKEVMKDATIS